MAAIDPLTAGGVLLATAATDAVYVMFTSAVVARACGNVEQRMVSALLLRCDQLYGELGLCRLRGCRFVAWRVCIDHIPAPATRRSADRCRA
jgi:hypothetical protein